MDSDIKTRVTPAEDLSLPRKPGQDCLVTIYSPDPGSLGRRQVLGRDAVTLGRGSDNTIVLENDSVSRQHCRVERRGAHYDIVDLKSTNGTYVNDEPIDEIQRLQRGDQLKVGDRILKFLSGSDMEAQYHETIYQMTIEDALTGVHNKRYLLDTLERELPRARRHGRPLALLMFDIDHFKQVNDSFGHLAGDVVLKDLAQLVLARLRPDDVLCRYGGEEFSILLPETGLEGASEIAAAIRGRVEAHAFVFEEETIDVTISLGVALLEDEGSASDFIGRADERLYRAKRDGRNRVAS